MSAHSTNEMSIKPDASNVNLSNNTEWWTPRLAWPVIAAAAVRFTLLAVLIVRNGISAVKDLDTYSFLEPGRNLLLHGRFVADGVPDLFRTPGYPIFLAITCLAGLPAAAVANVILSVFSVILIWKLGRAVFDDNRIALGAAWIFAFEPIGVIYSILLMSEALFLTLFLISMERLAMFLRGHKLPVLAVAGLWLAAATFVRPVTYYLPVALALGLFLVMVRVPGLRWKAPALLLVSVLPWFAAWQIRNWIETGYSGFSSVTEVNLYFFVAADVKARMEHRPLRDVRIELGFPGGLDYGEQAYLYEPYLALHPEQTRWNQAQRLAFMRSDALHSIGSHYGIYLRSCIESLSRVVFELGVGELHHRLIPESIRENLSLSSVSAHGGILRSISDPWVLAERAVFSVTLLGLYLFAARGAIHGDMHNTCLWMLFGISLYFLVITGLTGGGGGYPRYRLPIMPIVCIFASAGFQRTKKIAQLVGRRELLP